ncbi:MAG: RUS1 family protein, partial [Brevundimonas sp.]
AALMWVVANGMEILTFVIQGVFSQGFTLLVACSVSLKQISILTASATRGTFYKQFAGRNENLGDITAKGDAQVWGVGCRARPRPKRRPVTLWPDVETPGTVLTPPPTP